VFGFELYPLGIAETVLKVWTGNKETGGQSNQYNTKKYGYVGKKLKYFIR
jgi:hypothetical protein